MMDLTQTITIADLLVATGSMQAEINQLKESKDYWFKRCSEVERDHMRLQGSIADLKAKYAKGCSCDSTGECSCDNTDHKIGGTDG